MKPVVKKVAARVAEMIALDWSESFVAAYLGPRNRVLSVEIVAKGSLYGVAVDRADVLRRAQAAGAKALIVAHNHPSGDPTPSEEDRLVTALLTTECATAGIKLIDHVVVAQRGASARPCFASAVPSC